jgi:hypothetical protein
MPFHPSREGRSSCIVLAPSFLRNEASGRRFGLGNRRLIGHRKVAIASAPCAPQAHRQRDGHNGRSNRVSNRNNPRPRASLIRDASGRGCGSHHIIDDGSIRPLRRSMVQPELHFRQRLVLATKLFVLSEQVSQAGRVFLVTKQMPKYL